MDSFDFKQSKDVLRLQICGQIYEFNVSATNYSFIKQIANLTREVENVMLEFNRAQKGDLADLEKLFDMIKDKERSIIDLLLPGKWDELFELAGTDLLNMVDLIVFIADHVKRAGVASKKAAIKAEAPKDAPEI